MSHSVDMKESLQTLDHDQKSSESTGPSVQCPNDENINSIGAENKKQQLDINSSDSSDSFDCSNASDISSLISGQGWKPPDKSLRWIQSQIVAGVNPRNLLGGLVDEITVDARLPGPMDGMTLWRIIAGIISDPPRRKKLSHINTLDNVVQLLKDSSNIIVLTGAGVSVSCGIPDFRSKDGIYSRLAIDYPNLPDPQAMFDINYFRQDPRPFFKFAKEIYPGMFKPSPCHKFIQLLETKGKLLRNYTQNIDTLEQVAGIRNVVECHGSFATASCTKCKHRVDSDAIRDDIFAQKIPMCNKCNTVDNMDEEFIKSLDLLSPVENETYQQLYDRGIMKPDIVFFGEGLSDDFHEAITRDKNICDLLIVIGSSLKVRPVALIPHSLPAEIPQILINREELMHFEFDVELLGDSDTIIGQICNLLGPDWSESCGTNVDLQETTVLMDEDKKPEERSMRSESSSFELSSFNPPALLSGDENSCTVENFNNIGSEKISERHMSCDSTAKDSGIGDASNSTTFQQQCETNSEIQTSADEDYEETNALKSRLQLNGIVESDVEYIGNDNDEDEDVDEGDDDDDEDDDDDDEEDDDDDDDDEDEDLRSVAELLPPNTFFRLNTYKYIFPGAEVYMDEADNKSDDPDKDTDNTDSGLATASENRNSNDSVELLQFRDDANSTNANTDEPDNWPKLSTPDNLQSKSIRKTTDLNSEEDGETPKKRLRIDDDEENSNSFTVVKSIQ